MSMTLYLQLYPLGHRLNGNYSRVSESSRAAVAHQSWRD